MDEDRFPMLYCVSTLPECIRAIMPVIGKKKATRMDASLWSSGIGEVSGLFMIMLFING